MTSEELEALEKLANRAFSPHTKGPDMLAAMVDLSFAIDTHAFDLIAAARENARLRAVVEAARKFTPFSSGDELIEALSALDAKEQS
jgi:uncharacterized protein with von Willebrand factor type A (vWA) domain